MEPLDPPFVLLGTGQAAARGHALGFGPPLSSESALVRGVRCGPVLAMPCALGFGPMASAPMASAPTRGNSPATVPLAPARPGRLDRASKINRACKIDKACK